MKLKHWVIVGIVAVFLAAIAFGGIQSCRLNKIKNELATEKQKDAYEEEKVRVEKVIIEKVGELTSDELTKLLNGAVE